MAKAENYMVINSETGQSEDIMGKYMYYSLPKLFVKAEKVKEICEKLNFPIGPRENISKTDAFKSATGDIRDRIEEKVDDNLKIRKIYCRDNIRVESDVISRELVEETLYEKTNSYRKLANITLDKATGKMVLSDVEFSSGVDVYRYFNEAERLFELYQDCIGNSGIETMAGKYVSGLHALNISARGYHYFVPKAYMQGISLLEDFMELISRENLFEYKNKRDAKYISINSMYVVDDDKQRKKMAHEFYQSMGAEIEEYQRRIEKLIRNGNSSQAILDRWELKIRALEHKKREYETILKQNLSGMDENFMMLRSMCDQFKYNVRASSLAGLAA